MAFGQTSSNAQDPWYIVQLKPGGLKRAQVNLKRQGYESFAPLREETHRRDGRFETSLRPLFPGYLFVQVPDNKQQWRSINATFGVSRLVTLEAGCPTQVPEDIIAALQMVSCEDSSLNPSEALKVGDQIKVVSGPLAEKIAEIDAIPDQGRIYVLFELMGRYTRALLSASDVERAAPSGH